MMIMTLYTKINRNRRELMRIMLRYLADRGSAPPTHLIWKMETGHRMAVEIFTELENIGAIKKILGSPTDGRVRYLIEITDQGRKILQDMDMLVGLTNM